MRDSGSRMLKIEMIFRNSERRQSEASEPRCDIAEQWRQITKDR